jgi:hypothetical protein
MCVSTCPLMTANDATAKFDYYVNATTTGNFNYIFDLTSQTNYDISVARLTQMVIDNGGSTAAATIAASFPDPAGSAAYYPLVGATNVLGNYCLIQVDSTITEVAALIDQITTLVTSMSDSAIKSLMGTGSMAQVMSSVIYSIDLMFLAFIGSAVVGFMVLGLFAYKPFIMVVT